MVNVYDGMRDNDGIAIGRTKLFISKADDDGNILSCQSGTLFTPEESGALFIVDDWLIPQIDKLLFVDGTLVVKDGETLDVPVKSDIELQEEELLRQLAELRAQKSEPAQ